MIDVVLSFLQVYFQAFLSNHSLFCFRLLFPISSLLIFQILGILRFPLKNGVKYRLKILITEAADFFYFQSLPYSCISSGKSYGKFATSCKKDKTSFCQLGAISRSMIIHDWVWRGKVQKKWARMPGEGVGGLLNKVWRESAPRFPVSLPFYRKSSIISP